MPLPSPCCRSKYDILYNQWNVIFIENEFSFLDHEIMLWLISSIRFDKINILSITVKYTFNDR